MELMEEQVQTSTPITFNKSIPPPPRSLWGQDSVTEQLYHNKWVKYRNSIEEKEPSWSELNAPCFVDFENIPDIGDSYFDYADVHMFETPQKTLDKPLPGSEENNNNILESLRRCSLSAIKKHEPDKRNDEIMDSLDGTVDLTSHVTEATDNFCSSTVKNNNVEEMEMDVPESPTTTTSNDGSSKQPLLEKPKLEKNRSDSRNSTIIEPFSFEEREKCRQEHVQARRERDCADKEVRRVFHANPVPNFVKYRKNRTNQPAKPQAQKQKLSEVEKLKLCNAAESWKKKAYQPSLPKKVTVAPKAPKLLTAARAKKRQSYEEQLREKERHRQALREIEEAAKKKREEEEIAKLRKELVHKAQPIRKYKLIIPRMEKRPLSEPMTPMTCKRRRKV